MVTANKNSTKGGKSENKDDKKRKQEEKKRRQERAAKDGSWVPKAGPPKTEAQLREEKLLRVAKSLADSKKEKESRMLRAAELIAAGMKPEDAAKNARDEAVERCKPQAAEFMTKDQHGKKYSIKAEASNVPASVETADPHFIQQNEQNGSNDAATGGEEQVIMKNVDTTPEKIEAAAGTTPEESIATNAPASDGTGIETQQNQPAEAPAEAKSTEKETTVVEEKRLAVDNVRDLFQHVNFETGIEIPSYIDLVSALDGAPLTLEETAFVVPMLGRECGNLVVKTRAFYTEEEARLCVEAQNDHYALKKDDVVRFKPLAKVLQQEKQGFDAWMVIKNIPWRNKDIWHSRTEMLAHSADPFGLPLVAGELPVIDDKAKAGVLNTWDDYREDLAHFIMECGLRLPEEPEQWTEFLRKFDDDRRRRNKRNPRFPVSVLTTNLFKSEMPDGAAIAVPEAMLDMVLDALADANVKVHYAWAYRWLTQTKEMLPWFAERAKELAEELEEQKRQEAERKLVAERQAAKKAAQDIVRSRFQEQIAKLGGRGVSNPSRERDDDGDQRGGNSRRWNGNRANDARR